MPAALSAEAQPSTVSYQDRLPLAWQPLAEGDALPLDRLADQNLRVLSAVAVLEERRVKPENASGVELEVERLHLKMDVLLELMGALLRSGQAGEGAVPVRLSGEGASWQAAEAPALGARGLLVLHLHPCIAQPLRWPAVVTQQQDGQVRVRFEPLGEACEAALHRHVFLHHRREVAGARAPNGTR